MKAYPFFFIFLLIGCSQSNDCAKHRMSNSRFVYLNENGIIPNSYFVFGDTTYKEYADDTLYSTGLVVWNSCDKYSLIVKDARYNTNEWVNPGDTIHVEIISSDNDTVLCVVRAFNASNAVKLLKVNQPR